MKKQVTEILHHLFLGEDLNRRQSRKLFEAVMVGGVEDELLSAALIAFKFKGEKATEIAGAVDAISAHSVPFATDSMITADCCGTGGDGSNTFNISTTVALLAAASGIKMVKHGNRAISSQSGSSDVLEQLGIGIEETAENNLQLLRETGFCYLHAPAFHPGFARFMPIRKLLGVRTFFNLLGPLLNPARPRYQLMGVFDPALCEPAARTLKLLGCERGLVVHGAGLDEVAIHDETTAVYFDKTTLETLQITPELLGCHRFDLSEIQGGNSAENAEILQTVLAGRGSDAQSQVVAANAGALFWVCGLAENWRDGVELALAKLASGDAVTTLERIGELSAAPERAPTVEAK